MSFNGGPHESGGPAQSIRSGASEDERESVRRSQRQPLSCTECTRRKTRCDRTIPCSNCIKRGKVAECKVEVTVKQVTGSSRSNNNPGKDGIDRLRLTLTQTTNQHENRIAMLENMVAQLTSHLSHDRPGVPRFQLIGGNRPSKTEPDGSDSALTRINLDANADADDGMIDTEAEAASTLEWLAMGRSRAKTTGALVEGAAPPSDDENGEMEEMEQWNGARDQRDSEPHHASTSRRRGSDASSSSSASGRRSPPRAYDERPSPLLAPSYPLASTHGAARQVSALPHMLANSHQPPQSATRPSLISRPSAGGSTSLKRGAMSMLPSEQAGRALIAYDVDQVSWFHTAYHRATFAAECALFWEEGASGEVEVNKNWLSLLFAVLSSGLHHMPFADAQRLFPGEDIQALILRFFDASVLALNEANWMETHSLYSTQTILVLCLTANHLGRSDWYLSALAVGIRIAQTLNINNLGKDSYPAAEGAVLPPMDPNALILREMCKRIWYQLLIQDWFHLPFNRTSVISGNQFNSAVPLHCTDESLLSPATLIPLSIEVPTFDSHTGMLLQLALKIHKLFDGLLVTKTVPYSLVLSTDAEVAVILKNGPSWTQLDANGRPNPLPKNAPSWLDWSRMTFLVSSAHKIIILHRPFLGRAFADPAYQKSRDTCVLHARRILQYLRDCPLEQFRKTWTTLIHSVAAAVILILEVSHTQNASTHLDAPLELVLSAIEIFRSLRTHSTIADKGVRVLEQLLRDSAKRPDQLNNNKRKLPSDGRTEVELERAIKALRRKNNLAGSASSASPPAGVGPGGAGESPRSQQQQMHHPSGFATGQQQQQQQAPSPQAGGYGTPSGGLTFPSTLPSPAPHGQTPYQNHALGAFGFPSGSGFSAPASPHPNQGQHPSNNHSGPFGGGGSGVWSPHLYNYNGGQARGIGGGSVAGGYDALFEGLNAFELSGLLEFEQGQGQG